MPAPDQIVRFVAESNLIEGIDREPTGAEVAAHLELISGSKVTLKALTGFVDVVAPGARLRSMPGMDVRVGPHVPPPGGPVLVDGLRQLLSVANVGGGDPLEVHVAYETIHPFTDGNGRSGRALWAWMMLRQGRSPFHLPFLHRWYYDSLEAVRG